MSKVPRPGACGDVQIEVGKRIRWVRELLYPNRAEFARLMGVDRSTLQKIEDGSRPPSIFNLLSMTHRLRVTADYILMGSLRGVDGVLAAMLIMRHPELASGTGMAKTGDPYRLPTRPD